MNYVTCVYEDDITHLVMLKMFDQFPKCFSEHCSIHCHGFGKIKKNILAYNNAANYGYYFIITDLDKNECAPSLIGDWLPVKHGEKLVFRVAVREIESWLLADRNNFASFFRVSRDLIPLSPENEPDPKKIIFSLARRSQKRDIREGIPPIDNMASIGPGYNIELGNFINNYWDIAIARTRSNSLDRALKALQKIAPPDNLCSKT
jgi:hypothetical protein